MRCRRQAGLRDAGVKDPFDQQSLITAELFPDPVRILNGPTKKSAAAVWMDGRLTTLLPTIP